MSDEHPWRTLDSAPRGKYVEGLTARGDIVEARRPASDGKVRDANTLIDRAGVRHVCTHWRPFTLSTVNQP